MTEEKQDRVVIRVQPSATRNEMLGFKDGELHIRIAAPPIRGKANQELIRFLSQVLGVNKSSLRIEKGMTSRMKVISIDGLTRKQVTDQLERLNRR